MFNPIISDEQANRIRQAMQAATSAIKFDRTVFVAETRPLVSDHAEQRATYLAKVL